MMRARSSTLLIFAVILAIVILTYRQALGAYFIEDDFQWLVSTWSFHAWDFLDVSRYDHFYRPVIQIYFSLGVRLFGHSSALFHAASILLHALNGLAVYILTLTMTRDRRAACFAAVGFVVLPGYVDAVAWVGAIAEPLAALFYCLTLCAFLQYLSSERYAWQLAAMTTFALALLTHESSATLIVTMGLAEWAVLPRRTLRRLWVYAPYVVLLGVYLAIEAGVTSRNYVIQEGYYRVGLHAARNVLDYIVSLYVGKRVLVSYIGVSAAIAVFLAKGSRRVRFATLWMLIALMPFAFFTWGNTSRYLYLPAIGFSMLLAEGMIALERLAARWLPQWRTAVVLAVFFAIVLRFATFTARAVDEFSERTAAYREYARQFRTTHPVLSPGAVVRVPVPADKRLRLLYLEPLVQWEYADPSIRLEIEPQGARF